MNEKANLEQLVEHLLMRLGIDRLAQCGDCLLGDRTELRNDVVRLQALKKPDFDIMSVVGLSNEGSSDTRRLS